MADCPRFQWNNRPTGADLGGFSRRLKYR
ncbi:hypothetical protein MIMGU_mgv1a0147492mg, partial [Erythranthe guttata]